MVALRHPFDESAPSERLVQDTVQAAVCIATLQLASSGGLSRQAAWLVRVALQALDQNLWHTCNSRKPRRAHDR